MPIVFWTMRSNERLYEGHVAGPGWERRKFARFSPREAYQTRERSAPWKFLRENARNNDLALGKKLKRLQRACAEIKSRDPWISREKKPFSCCLNRERSAPWKIFRKYGMLNQNLLINSISCWYNQTNLFPLPFASMRSDSIFQKREVYLSSTCALQSTVDSFFL